MMEIELGDGWIFHKNCKVMKSNFDWYLPFLNVYQNFSNCMVCSISKMVLSP